MAASVWRGRITFGLVSIPVRLLKAARRERTRFRRVQRVRAADAVIEDDSDVSGVPEQCPRVLPFRSAGKNVITTLPEDPSVSPPVEEPVVRVRNASVSGLTEAAVQPKEILKGYEVGNDEFVVLDPAEVAALRPRTSSELEVTEFVKRRRSTRCITRPPIM